MAALKARCEDARALGIIQSGESELMIIYNGKSSASRRSLSDACSRWCGDGCPPDFIKGHKVLIAYLSDFGCYVTKHGQPSRKCEIIRWETPADGCSRINGHVLLVSREFIEIRDVATGRLIQVMEGQDFRLVHSMQCGLDGAGTFAGGGDKVLIAVRGEMQVEEGYSDALMEMIETAPLESMNVSEEMNGRDSESLSQWE